MGVHNKLVQANERGLISESAVASMLLLPPSTVRRRLRARGVLPCMAYRHGKNVVRLYAPARADELAAHVTDAESQKKNPTNEN